MSLTIEQARMHLESLCRGLLGAGLTPWVLARVLTGVAQDACALEREAGAARRFQMGTGMQQAIAEEEAFKVHVKELSKRIADRIIADVRNGAGRFWFDACSEGERDALRTTWAGIVERSIRTELGPAAAQGRERQP